jgi:hypothetical protein
VATKSRKTRKPSKTAAKNAAAKAEPKTGASPKDAASVDSTPKKTKRIVGTFSMPASDYALIGELKTRLKARKLPTKKNQLLRAGLRVLAEMAPIELQEAIDSLATTQKAPRKNKK